MGPKLRWPCQADVLQKGPTDELSSQRLNVVCQWWIEEEKCVFDRDGLTRQSITSVSIDTQGVALFAQSVCVSKIRESCHFTLVTVLCPSDPQPVKTRNSHEVSCSDTSKGRENIICDECFPAEKSRFLIC